MSVLRDAIEAGWVDGPRMMCAGAYVTCPGGGGDLTGLAVDVDAVAGQVLSLLAEAEMSDTSGGCGPGA